MHIYCTPLFPITAILSCTVCNFEQHFFFFAFNTGNADSPQRAEFLSVCCVCVRACLCVWQTTKVQKANFAFFFFPRSNRLEKTTPVCPSEASGMLCCGFCFCKQKNNSGNPRTETASQIDVTSQVSSLCGCTKLKAVECTEMAGCARRTHKQRDLPRHGVLFERKHAET